MLDYSGTLADKSDDLWLTRVGEETLLSGNTRSIAVDSWGQVWVGTFGGGAGVYSDLSLERVYLPTVLHRSWW